MVNEINKPSDGQAASNQTLTGTQVEQQQQLMEQMEQLRVQEQQSMESREEYEQTVESTTTSSCKSSMVAEEVMQIRCTTTEETIVEVVDADEVPAGAELVEKTQLAKRLAASNQALVDMQTEHKQLMEEMEQLRARAEQLQSVKANQAESLQQYEKSVEESSTVSSTSSASGVAQEVMKVRCTTTEEVTVEEVDEDENPEEAAYIRAKLAELAQLKAQYNRVQNLISTTDMIEKHLSKQKANSLAEVKQAAEAIRSTASTLTKQASHEVVQQQSSESVRSATCNAKKQASHEVVQKQSAESLQSVSSSSVTKQASHQVVQQQQSTESVQSVSSSVTQQASHEVMQQQSAESLQSVSSTSMAKQESHQVVQQQSSKSSSSSTAVMEAAIEQSVSSSSSEATVAGVDEKQQLLVTMIDMFDDFNSDLKKQAEGLRSERERIKALKETIIRSKQEGPK
ncbi:secreted 45 kDa protein [Stomoxys calcitrans]|uniref:secreted 45 kDa protein n=1 Tax=Stomoxys calcitrans TaxID=35570 RepID=UPI0027E3AA8D|nr:secreted 45 kDa protein [Stomoxys calcitrans]XP_013116097.2 secreted 45 kDa protein [Stomoxys calcitrans]XP_013116098.2 secreted 45 kDa protein [Stomoxys calcitrans]XP_013116099.2 secreted 45 kDa protein [Stomoxys calcitrans]XP_013116101.2 secreted 45 kDa protein [Stomoxys calcitrans]